MQRTPTLQSAFVYFAFVTYVFRLYSASVTLVNQDLFGVPFAVVEGFDKIDAGGELITQFGQLCVSRVFQTSLINHDQLAGYIQEIERAR